MKRRAAIALLPLLIALCGAASIGLAPIDNRASFAVWGKGSAKLAPAMLLPSGGLPPDVTAPVITCDAACAPAWQRVTATADEPSQWASRAIIGTKFGAWSAYSASFSETFENYWSLTPQAGKTWNVEVKARDAAGNESLVCADSFTWQFDGSCP